MKLFLIDNYILISFFNSECMLVKQNESLYKVMFISIRDERHLITACRVTPTLSCVYRHALFGMACLSGTIRIV